MTESTGFSDILRILSKRKFLIFLVTLSAILVMGLYISVIRTPVYLAAAEVLLVQKEVGSEASIRPFSNIETYRELIESPVVLLKVKEKLELPSSFEQLSDQVTVENPRNSQVLIIRVKNPNVITAANIANEITEELQKTEYLLTNSANVNVLSQASGSENPQTVGIGLLKSLCIAAIAGIILGIGISFLLEYTNNTIKNEKEILEILDLPVLGVVSFTNGKKNPGEIHSSPHSYNKTGKSKMESTIQHNS